MEVLTGVLMQTVFLDVAPCLVVHRCRSCGGTFRLHLLVGNLGLFVRPADGDGRSVRGIGTCVQNHTASHPRKHHSLHAIWNPVAVTSENKSTQSKDQ